MMRILVKKASDPDEYVINQDVEFKNQSVKIPIPVQEEPCNQSTALSAHYAKVFSKHCFSVNLILSYRNQFTYLKLRLIILRRFVTRCVCYWHYFLCS